MIHYAVYYVVDIFSLMSVITLPRRAKATHIPIVNFHTKCEYLEKQKWFYLGTFKQCNSTDCFQVYHGYFIK